MRRRASIEAKSPASRTHGLAHAAQFAGEDIAAIFDRASPAAFHILGALIEADGNCRGKTQGLGLAVRRDRLQRTGDRRLLDAITIIARMEPREHVAHGPRLFDDRAEVGAGTLLAARQPQHGGLKTIANQIILTRTLVLQILFGTAALDFVERRLRNIKMTALDQLSHLPEEKCEQKRANMRAVDIRVCHDDDLVIA